MKRVDRYQLNGFKSLGPIQYEDDLGLMSGASAVVINPSLFDGWNAGAGIEDAKSRGKAVGLSENPAHREQNPDRAWYSRPRNVEDMATALADAADIFDSTADQVQMGRAKAKLPGRLRSFAGEYLAIVLHAAGHAGS